MQKRLFTVVLALSTIGLGSLQAQAASLEISVTQDGNNVVFSGSGSIDLTGLGNSFSSDANSSRSQFNIFGGASGTVDIYSISIPTFVPLNNGFFVFNTIAGDNFFVQGLNAGNTGFLAVNSGYTSDSPIEFTWTANNQTIAQLALNFGTVAQFGNNTVSLVEGSSGAVPEPLTILGATTAIAFGAGFKHRLAKVKKK